MANPQVTAYGAQQTANLDAIDKSVDGIAADVAWQKKELDRWNSLPPTWTPEDQSILDGLITRTAGLADRVTALDALTDAAPAAPAEPTPPTP